MSSRPRRKSNPGPAVEEPEAKTALRSTPRKEPPETRAVDEPAEALESKRLKAQRWAEENLPNFNSTPTKRASAAQPESPAEALTPTRHVPAAAGLQRTPSSIARAAQRREAAAAAVTEQPASLRRSARGALPDGPFSRPDDKEGAESTIASDVPPVIVSPKRSHSPVSLPEQARTGFRGALWTLLRVVLLALLTSAALFAGVYYKLYLLSPEQVLGHLKSALLLLRDRSIVVLACALGAVVCLCGASALYQRRQKHTDMVNLLAQIAKSLLVEFNSLNNGQKVCPVDALMEDSFDRLAADLGKTPDRALLISLWPRVERQVVQDKRVSVAKLEVGGKVQRCWRFLDSRAYNCVD